MVEQLNRAFARWWRAIVYLTASVPCLVALVLVGALLQTVTDTQGRQEAATRGTLLLWPRQGAAAALAAQVERLPGVAGTVSPHALPLPDDPNQESGWDRLFLWAVHSSLDGHRYAPPTPGLALAAGRLPESAEEALVGFELARVLHLQVGSTVWAQGRAFTVCGIWQPAGLAAGNFLQVPCEAAALLTPGGGEPQPVIAVLEAGAAPESVLAEVRSRLPDAAAKLPDDLYREERRWQHALTVVAAAVALLAALSCGPAAVQAIRPLAGSRLGSVGATGVLGALSGTSGLCLGWGAAHLLNAVAVRHYACTPLRVSPTLAALAVLWPTVSATVAGLVAQRGRAGEVGRLWRYGVAGATVALAVMVALLAGSLAESLSTALQRTHAGNVDRLSVTAGERPLSGAHVAQAAALPGLRGLVVEANGGALVEAEEGWPGRPPSGVLYGVDSADGTTGAEVPYPVRLAVGRALAAQDEVILGADLARSRGLGLGDLLEIRGRDLTVVGIRERFPFDALSPVNYRADVSLEALRDLLGEPELLGRVTLLMPPMNEPVESAPFMQRIGEQMGRARVTVYTEVLTQVAARYPGGQPLTGREPMAQVQGLYQRLLLLSLALALVTGGLAVAGALHPVYLEQRREIAVCKLVGAGPGQILAGYLWSALAVASAGALLGCYAAWTWSAALNEYLSGSQVWPVLVVTPRLMALVGGLSILAALLCALHPGLSAAAVDPARVLHAGRDGDGPAEG